MTESNLSIIQSPCVSNCCLDDEDICLGCYRHIDEILEWSAATDPRRIEIKTVANERQQAHKIKYKR